MDPHSNRLRAFAADEHMPESFEQLPPELTKAAQAKLAGAIEATVSRNSGGKLSKWAKKRRKQIAQESKRKNRK